MYLSIHQIILASVEGDQLKPVNYEAIEPAGPCTCTFHYLPDRTRFAIFVQVWQRGLMKLELKTICIILCAYPLYRKVHCIVTRTRGNDTPTNLVNHGYRKHTES